MITLQIIAGLLSAYLIYYAQQKGKNQADKQDLKKLTEIVEEVKQKYVQENELLKSSLTILTNKQNVLFAEGKNAIIEFYSNLNKWLWHNLNISAHEYNHTNFTELSSRILTMRDHYNDTNISNGKIQILLNDDALIQASHDAIMETLFLHQFVEKPLKGLQTTLSTDKYLLDTLFSKEIKFESLSQDMKSFYQNRADENTAEKKQILATFINERSTLFSNAMSKRNAFCELAKKYLQR
jgi:hypothetical protein